MYQRHVIHLGIAKSASEAYAYLAEPRNFPMWAAVVESTFHQIGPSEWAADTEFGPRIVRFCERNPFGVLDHAVFPEGGVPMMMPMRVTPNGEGCDLTFIFYRRPDMSDEQFTSAIEWVTTDFLVLKGLLET